MSKLYTLIFVFVFIILWFTTLANFTGFLLENLLNLTDITYQLKLSMQNNYLDFISSLIILVIILVILLMKRNVEILGVKKEINKSEHPDQLKEYFKKEAEILSKKA